MTPKEERAYMMGARSAASHMLGHLLRELGASGDPEVVVARLTLKRAQTIAVLRRVCEDHGDNDWPDDLHLADIIDKHLAAYLDD